MAPDLARGAMLLLIALANVHLFLLGPAGVRGYPAGLAGMDAVVAFLQMVLVDGRAYPLFALLVGYGAAQSARRWEPAVAVSLLRRRGGWMLAIGAVHGLLLFPGDIVGAYGLLLVALAGVVVRGTAVTLGTIAVLGCVFTVLTSAFSGFSTGAAALPSIAAPDVGSALVQHVGEWSLGTVNSALVTAGMVALGALLGRRRLLEEPDGHRRVLRRVALLGLAVAVAGGVPLALAAAGWWAPTGAQALLAGVLHGLGGLAGGLGYAAVFALVATRWAPRPLLAAGRRSLSCYLGQSVVWMVLLPAWTLGFGARLSVAQAALLAVGVWGAGLVGCAALDRGDRRGPAEILLRRLTYGPAPIR
ncbi:Uncharacterized membrane protein YeiB [Pseudonocardia oroxyli]|uniref:Uncharacterized membrane protein YeiB n=1 Tax=Pseudonocardia oroxyli TaxID=366584 RepID=A0A1G7EDH4_PSEOR|nr:Uncharacterized membrane protein YeiB [Pseudonocardia oroxyli]